MTDSASRPTCLDLFLGFFSIGIFGFGGVLPWARRLVVEQRRWMTAAEFTDLLGLCQFLPGGNIMNLTIALGARFRGVFGAAAAFFGLMTGPVAIVVLLGVVYEQYRDLPVVQRGFAALAAAASGFVLATALRIGAPLRTRPLGLAVATVTFGSVALLRLPLLLVLPIMAAVSTLIQWRRV
jgi:chromate transporter